MNKTVDGKQLTITWNVDNLKTSHIDRKLVLRTILWLELVYGDMHGTRGTRHEYPGMWMKYPKKGGVSISTEGYLREVLEYFVKKITRRAKTMAPNHLRFQRRPTDPPTSEIRCLPSTR